MHQADHCVPLRRTDTRLRHRLKLLGTASPGMVRAAVRDVSDCYKVIVFYLLDACDCQGTDNKSIYLGERSHYVFMLLHRVL